MGFRNNDDILGATAKISKAGWRFTAWTAKKTAKKGWQWTRHSAAFWGRRHPLLKAAVYVGGAALTSASTAYAATESATKALTAGGGVIATAGLLMGFNKFCSWADKDEKRRKDAQAS